MRLAAAQVCRVARSATDSLKLSVDEHVTALVGKNESGKTVVLEAMYRFQSAAQRLCHRIRGAARLRQALPSTRPRQNPGDRASQPLVPDQ
jgi:ABC-type phosphate transport system ATPase subunit